MFDYEIFKTQVQNRKPNPTRRKPTTKRKRRQTNGHNDQIRKIRKIVKEVLHK